MDDKKTKVCSKCGEEKELGEFIRATRNKKTGRTSVCKECNREYMRKYAEKNKEKINTRNRELYDKNKEEINIRRRELYNTIPGRKEYNSNRTKKYYEEHKEETLERCSEYNKRNRKKVSEYYKEWIKEKRKVSDFYLIVNRLRVRLSAAFGAFSKMGKCKRSDEYGINYQAIIERLGPCPGDRNDYHIDHIRPLCSFDFDDLEQIKQAFAPKNHQWLLNEENLRKGAKRE